MKINKLLWLLPILLLLGLNSCKKDEEVAEQQQQEQEEEDNNLLCEGTSGNQIFPLTDNSIWTYGSVAFFTEGEQDTMKVDEDIVELNGITFKYINSSWVYYPWMIENYLGYDAQGNLYHHDGESNNMEIFIPSNLQVGTTWNLSEFTDFNIFDSCTVVNLDASLQISTLSGETCQFNDLIQIETRNTSDGALVYEHWYKKGVGMVKFKNYDSLFGTQTEVIKSYSID